MAQVGPSAALAFLATSPLIAGEDSASPLGHISARLHRRMDSRPRLSDDAGATFEQICSE